MNDARPSRPTAVENVRPAQPEKILLPLQHTPKQRQPERKQHHQQRNPQAGRVRQFPGRQNFHLPDPHAESQQETQPERSQPCQPDHARQLAFPVRGQRLGGLLGEHHLQRHIRHEHHHCQQHPEHAIFRRRDFFVQQMDRVHHHATGYIRNHQPATLAEKCGVMRSGACRGRLGCGCGHGRRTIKEPDGSGKRFQKVQKQIFAALQRCQ